MNFNAKEEAEAFGHKIGATHIKYKYGQCLFIKEHGHHTPIFNEMIVDEYSKLETTEEKLVYLGHMYHSKADLLYIERLNGWFGWKVIGHCYTRLIDMRGVEKLELRIV